MLAVAGYVCVCCCIEGSEKCSRGGRDLRIEAQSSDAEKIIPVPVLVLVPGSHY